MTNGIEMPYREILLGLGPDDWEYLHGLESVLARRWAQALGLHAKAIVFNVSFRALMATRVAQLPVSKQARLVESLRSELQDLDVREADAEAFRKEMPERLRAILELPDGLFPLSDRALPETRSTIDAVVKPEQDEPADDTEEGPALQEDHPTASTKPNQGPADPTVTPDDWTHETLEELEALREPLTVAVDALLEEVNAGARPTADPTPLVTRWSHLWAEVPREASTLTEARTLAESALQERRDVAADSVLVAQVVGLRFPPGNERAVGEIAEVQSEVAASPLPLDAGLRDGVTALLRALRSDWPSDEDVEVVANRFGQTVVRAAIRLSSAEGDTAGAVGPEPVPAPVVVGGDGTIEADDHGADAETADAQSAPTEPEANTSAEPDAEASVVQVEDGAAAEAEASVSEKVGTTEAEPEPADVHEVSAGPETEAEDGGPADVLVVAAVDDLSQEPVEHAEGTEPTADALPVPVKRVVEARRARGGEKARTSDPKPEAVKPTAEPEKPEADPTDYLARFDVACASGDFGTAYWYAVAGRDEARARAARLLVLATSSDMVGGTNARANAVAAQLGQDLDAASADLSEVIAAALVPAALLLPPYSEATLALETATSRLGGDCPKFIRLANTLTYERGSGLHALDAPLLLKARDEARAALEEFRERGAARTIKFQRATEVWRELIRQQGLLGSLGAMALEGRDVDQVRQQLASLEVRGVDRLIKHTDSQLNPMQARRQGIIAGAKQELAANIQRYLDLVRASVAAEESVRAIEHDSPRNNTALIEELIASLPTDRAEEAGFCAVTVGVARWLRDRLGSQEAASEPPTEAEMLARPLAFAFELERKANGDFDPAQVDCALLDAQQAREIEDAFVGYVERHDYVGLEALLHVVRATAVPLAMSLEERERRARAESRETLLRAIEHTRVGLARALSVTSLSDAEAQELNDKVERVARATNPHFREELRLLADIDAELAGRHQDRLDQAAKQLAELPDVNEAARARVSRLLASRDLLSAEEFLAQLSNGETSLPEEDSEDHTLEEFWAAAASAENAGPSWFTERLQAGRVEGRELPHPAAPERIKLGLAAWDRLAREGRPNGWDASVRDVLSALGFQQVRLGPRFSPGRGTSHNVFEARYDGYALIPTFGSAARGGYGIFLCWERKTVEGLLQAVRAAQEGARPTVVLYFQTMKAADRRLLAEQCRRKGLPNIVVDHAAMAYLGTREEARLDGLMHVCLPFTGSNPFTPFVLGDVPREMFYGRIDELRAVMDPHGPLFVYGGRQLGKSALLKTAMSEFGRFDDHHVSIYLDLKAEGIGEWHKADDLWRVLLPHLQVKGVVPGKVSKQAGPDVVASQVGDWLAGDTGRHLLLLLDESDAFLDQDSRPRAGDKGQFKNVYMLKNLMNHSERRFKPVFAGLHQVQRFHKESNGPMAHVGTEIPVGPLPPAEAYKLVVRPLAAIGYRFSSPDVVWRLLSHTNYQASLIQLFCKELVNDLNQRRLGKPPSVIDGSIVDRVYENKELRGQIAQRFEWTIQLDNRYRVIALVAAWLNLGDEETVAPVAVLRDQCADFWPNGFKGVTRDEFRALLDEMVGLGVLVRTRSDNYGIRSPNVIRLLGSAAEIESKLMESSTLELPTVFDPARYRRRLADRWRSPLTEAQAARLLANASEPTVIVASPALGADRMGISLAEIAASGDGVDFYPATPADLSSQLTNLLKVREARHLMVDGRGIDRPGLESALRKLGQASRAQARFTASVLLDPGDRVRLELPDVEYREVTLAPWTDEELRAVEPEADVPLNADVRRKLLELTGGWPDVLDLVLERGREKDLTTMIHLAEAEAHKVVEAGWPRFADRIGVSRGGVEERVLKTLLEWGEAAGRDDLAELLPSWEPERVSEALESLVRSGAIRPRAAEGALAGEEYLVNPLVGRTIQAGE